MAPANRADPTVQLPPLDPHAQIATANGEIYAIDGARLVHLDARGGLINTIPSATAVASDGKRVFALDGMDLVELDPRTLARRPIAHFAATWLAVHGDELIAAGGRGVWRIPLAGGTPTAVGVSAARGAAWQVGKPSAFMLDGDRLWYGIDAGEWGGGLGRLDVRTGKACALDLDEGVYGFARVAGNVYAYGGMIHIMVHEGYVVATNDCAAPVERYKTDRPIVALVPHGDHAFGVAWTDLDEVSADAKKWTKLTTIEAHSSSGRPDAMAGYPGVTGVLDLGDRTILATRSDGVWVLRGRELTQLLKPPS